MEELTVQEFFKRLRGAEMLRAINKAAQEQESSYVHTRRVRGEDLQVGMVVVKGEGRNRVKTELKERIPIFDGNRGSGRACNGVHFIDSHGQRGCWDRCAWNDVVV